MATFPVRGLHQAGILRDPSPTSLDLNAWSAGMNVRMHQNYAERAPVWRTLLGTLTPTHPAMVAGVYPSSDGAWLLVVSRSSHLWRYTPGSLVDVSPSSGWHAYSTDTPFTTCQLGAVVYSNNPTQQPFYYGPVSSLFAPLPGWDATWTCRSLRAYGDFLVALNVTKGATAHPFMVKTSDLALFGSPPGSWNQNDPTTSATENELEKLTTPLVDGLTLRNSLALYTSDQLWLMTQDGSPEVFHYEQLFSESGGGMISVNCGVEVDGEHYVFGPTDIYAHDGTSKGSIIDGRNRNYIFRNLIQSQTSACFAAYLAPYDSILFGYPTLSTDAAIQAPVYCNQGAIYDRNTKTWSFIDLPDVPFVTIARAINAVTWAIDTDTWASSTATWASRAGSDLGVVITASGMTAPMTKSRLLLYDFVDKGQFPQFTAESEVNPSAYLERTGADLDQLGADITTYKLVTRLYPIIKTYGGATMQVQWGAQQTSQGSVTYLPAKTFNPATQSKVDGIKGGKFLSVKFTMPTLHDFELVGFDVDMQPNGRRP